MSHFATTFFLSLSPFLVLQFFLVIAEGRKKEPRRPFSLSQFEHKTPPPVASSRSEDVPAMQLLFASERVHALPWLTAHLFPCAGVELYIIPAVPPYSSIPAQRKRLYTETKQEKEGGGDFFFNAHKTHR
jgi:hypothetical protein